MKYVNIHTHNSANTSAIENIQDVTSIGIHPWNIIVDAIDIAFVKIENELLENDKIIFIGECGLDRYIDTDISIQKDVLKKHFLLASKYKKPVIIHCVRAASDFLQMLREENIKAPFIIHGFTGNEHQVNQLLNWNVYFSFGNALFNNPKLANVLCNVPLERVFFETDVSDVRIETVYDFAAKTLGLSQQTLINSVFQNYKLLMSNFQV